MADTKEIQVNRFLPTPESVVALDTHLRTKFGEKFAGLVGSKATQLRVILTTDATAEDEQEILQIVLAHDFSERTPDQKARAERREKLLSMRKEMDTTPVSNDMEILQRRIDWLAMEITNLRERIGDE